MARLAAGRVRADVGGLRRSTPPANHPSQGRVPPVASSAIQRIEYDRETRTLFVIFVDGDSYAYLEVPEPVQQAFMLAESKGRFFAEAIRDRYKHRPLDLKLPPRPRRRA